MKKAIAILLALVLIFALILLPGCKTQTVDAGKASAHLLTFEHDGLTREYALYLPANLADTAPLVFVLHGYTQTSSDIITYGMNEVADAYGLRSATQKALWMKAAIRTGTLGLISATPTTSAFCQRSQPSCRQSTA